MEMASVYMVYTYAETDILTLAYIRLTKTLSILPDTTEDKARDKLMMKTFYSTVTAKEVTPMTEYCCDLTVASVFAQCEWR